tara:strand:- start:5177 stop:5602 length:426 start_codon:yes stop_codon:yes gene_type:complete
MINTIYAHVPLNDIIYSPINLSLTGERYFRNLLERSIKKSGIRDPVFILKAPETQMRLYVTSGNSRLNVARRLGIKKIPAVITQFDAERGLKGRILETDEEIRQLYYFPKTVEIKRKDGWVHVVQPKTGGQLFVDKYYELY